MPENPIGANGESNGQEAAAGPQAPPSAPTAADPALGAGSGSDSDALHAIGEPDTLPPTWCKKCEATVVPEGKGRCPRCQSFLRLNFARRKHPVNVLRRQQLLDKYVRDYQPATTLLHGYCEDLASIREQLEGQRPGSAEWGRLVDKQQQLGDLLEASKPTTQDNSMFAARMPVPALQLAADLLRRLKAGDELSQFEQGQLSILTMALRGEVQLPPAPAADIVVTRAEEQPAPDAEIVADAVPPAPPVCDYCHQPLRRCVEIRETNLESWQALHYDDPDEVKRRSDEATAVMTRPGAGRLLNWHSR